MLLSGALRGPLMSFPSLTTMNVKSLIPVVLLSVTVGCTGMQDMERDVAGLKHEVALLQSQLTEIEKSQTPLRKELATLNLRMDETLTELQGMRGTVDETQYLVQRELEVVNQRLAALENGGTGYSPGTTAPSASPIPSQPKPAPTLDPEEIYAQAYNVYKEGRLSSAREAFSDFLKQFPKTEYSDNAQFWIGECYYRENNYEDAILAYEDVVSKYPEGNKVPDALLKQGLCFQALGDDVSARIILQRVVENYPDTPQAAIARSKLETSR